MYEFTWKVFKETGNVNTYLLLKELEKEEHLNILPHGENTDESDCTQVT
ncbi:YqzL family protein [Lederbergia sp. NSJ-179]|nr:YqzL family protein [Lederbergia sp. NSJ-179]MCJ7841849.1 YqzL family protein [Lederbergia sp. NSJ-179]